jgi:hypothetical protein
VLYVAVLVRNTTPWPSSATPVPSTHLGRQTDSQLRQETQLKEYSAQLREPSPLH